MPEDGQLCLRPLLSDVMGPGHSPHALTAEERELETSRSVFLVLSGHQTLGEY